MKNKKSRLYEVVACFAFAGVVSGCGNSSPSSSTSSTLTPNQTSAVSQLMYQAMSKAMTTSKAQVALKGESALFASERDASQSVSITLNCSASGSVTVNGSFSSSGSGTQASPAKITMSFTDVFTNCTGTGVDGATYSVNSSGLTFTATFNSYSSTTGTVTTQVGTGTMTINGSLAVVSPGINANGSVNITESFTDNSTFNEGPPITSSTSFTGTISGTAFGQSVNGSFSFSG